MRASRVRSSRARLRRSRPRIADLNIVPYVDVLLVLLSIFVLVATTIRHGVEVRLPKTAAQPMPDMSLPIVVTIDVFGNHYLSTFRSPDEAVDESFVVSSVTRELARDPQRAVLIRADTKSDYGTVLRMMVLLRRAGAHDVGLVANASP